MKMGEISMIPKNIKREHIIEAIEEIERFGILKGRTSKRFLLEHNGKYYPPKYTISLANKYVNSVELHPSEFSGGKETNDFLRVLGFSIVEIPSPEKPIFKSFEKNDKIQYPKTHQGERCLKCKEAVRKLLEEIYGKVEQNYRFEMGTRLEDFENAQYYGKLKEIYETLQNHRGFEEFIKAKILPNCDFLVPNPGFIVEFDESQHFTVPRKLSLQCYPENLKLGFPKERWARLCEEISAKDNSPPYRDEQRAWYDTLRDFLPNMKGLNPTVRLYSREIQWCSLDLNNPNNVGKFRNLIENRRRGLRNAGCNGDSQI